MRRELFNFIYNITPSTSPHSSAQCGFWTSGWRTVKHAFNVVAFIQGYLEEEGSVCLTQSTSGTKIVWMPPGCWKQTWARVACRRVRRSTDTVLWIRRSTDTCLRIQRYRYGTAQRNVEESNSWPLSWNGGRRVKHASRILGFGIASQGTEMCVAWFRKLMENLHNF